LQPETGADEGLYRPEHRRVVYEAMLTAAAHVVASGRDVVLDATFAERARRDELRRWARGRGLEPWLVQTWAPRELVLDWLERRQAEGRDSSDAGPDFYETSRARYEPPEEWPQARHLRLDTSARDLDAEVAGLVLTIHDGRF
jgi:predicted kinase